MYSLITFITAIRLIDYIIFPVLTYVHVTMLIYTYNMSSCNIYIYIYIYIFTLSLSIYSNSIVYRYTSNI